MICLYSTYWQSPPATGNTHPNRRIWFLPAGRASACAGRAWRGGNPLLLYLTPADAACSTDLLLSLPHGDMRIRNNSGSVPDSRPALACMHAVITAGRCSKVGDKPFASIPSGMLPNDQEQQDDMSNRLQRLNIHGKIWLKSTKVGVQEKLLCMLMSHQSKR